MFTEFFYLLRQAYGLNLSPPEWQTLLRGLEAGLHRNSLLGFYELCRLTLAKSESDLDKLDRGFLDYFGDIDLLESVPEAFMEWLAHPEVQDNGVYNFKLAEANDAYSNNEVSQMFRERLRTQKEEHNRGNFYVGTSGVSPFGRNGYSPKGVRVGGEGRFRRAFSVAQRREFRDFREDQVLDLRQMQVAFRRLRQYSGREDVPETEFALAVSAPLCSMRPIKPTTGRISNFSTSTTVSMTSSTPTLAVRIKAPSPPNRSCVS